MVLLCLLALLSILSPTHAQSTVEIKEGTKLLTDTATFIIGANFSFSRIEVKPTEIVLGGYNLSVTSSGAKPNITITKFFTDYQTVFNLEGEAGSYAIIDLYTGSYGEPSSIKVNETPIVKNTDWWWFSSNSTVKVNITFESVRKLELNWPVPQTTISSTTVPSGYGGGVPTIIPIENATLTYSMPASLNVYKNETKEFLIKVTNPGTKALHNITIVISGIPKDSFSLSPRLVDLLESNQSTYFTVLINAQKITLGSYTLTFNISSSETYEETTMTLKVEEKVEVTTTIPITTTIPPEEEEKIEARVDTIKILLIVTGAIASTMIVVYLKLRKAKMAETPTTGPVLTYSVPASLDVYRNEKREFTVNVNNSGTMTLHNVTVEIPSLHESYYIVSPSLVESLNPNQSINFTVSLNPLNIKPGKYRMGIRVKSDETVETSELIITVKEKVEGEEESINK